ncbi:alpha/beta fold hydrolase [Alcaligenaceae bacterium]|nr:alpha/beta fold hydrolase [Alcaligenaceae bacterium]
METHTGFAGSDGASIYFEVTGAGVPILFIHEYAGDHRSWEPQVRHFSRNYQCITYNARGYPPSSVPQNVSDYSMGQAARDAVAVMDAAGIDKAHIVGLSMGSFASLQLGMDFPERCLSLVPSGCGHGAHPDEYEKSRQGFHESAARLKEIGMEAYAEAYAEGPWRNIFKVKDPRGWNEFKKQLAQHSVEGSAGTLGGVQGGRPCLWDFAGPLSRIELPVLVVAGDLDRPTLLPSLFLHQTLAHSSLCVLPRTGHTINLEEPANFNRILEQFFCSVEKGRY